MDSRYLQSFVLVAELGSIAAAVRRLDLTAATVRAPLVDIFIRLASG